MAGEYSNAQSCGLVNVFEPGGNISKFEWDHFLNILSTEDLLEKCSMPSLDGEQLTFYDDFYGLQLSRSH